MRAVLYGCVCAVYARIQGVPTGFAQSDHIFREQEMIEFCLIFFIYSSIPG